ncbi:MAG: ATP-binding protein [Chloroflexota bacterium]
MFARIRWRLVAWTMLVVGVILLALGVIVYAALDRRLMDQLDRNLTSRADIEGPAFGAIMGGGPGRRPGYSGGVFYVALQPDGGLFANPQQVNLEGASFPVPTGGVDVLATMMLNGEPTRVYVRLLAPPAPPGARLVVGQNLVPELGALRSLLVVLVVGGTMGLLMSLAGAWFLAGRALVPIERAFRRQQEFVADASHELRTPLTVLRSATDLLHRHRGEPLEANGELFDDVRAEIGRLERLTSDLLTLARSDRGELQLAVAEVDAAAIVADVVRRAEPLAGDRGVRLILDGGDAAALVEADPDRLHQLVLILLDNALEHTPRGGEVRARVGGEQGEVAITVADTGDGIPPEHLPHIFERFYRADAARTRTRSGAGLGLAIARTLAEAHGGTLTITSEPGAGTRATVRLPGCGGATADVAGAADRLAAGRE